MRKLLHYELIWFLHPLVFDYKFYFLHKLVEVRVLYEFHKNWLLRSSSENEPSKHLLLVFSRCYHFSNDNIYYTLQKEHFVWVRTRRKAFLSLNRNLVQVAGFDKLKGQMMRFPDKSLEKDMILFQNVEKQKVSISQ